MVDNGLAVNLMAVVSVAAAVVAAGLVVDKLLNRRPHTSASWRSPSEEDDVRRLAYPHAPAPVTNDFHADCIAVHEERLSYEAFLDRWRDRVPKKRPPHDPVVECFKEIMTDESYRGVQGVCGITGATGVSGGSSLRGATMTGVTCTLRG